MEEINERLVERIDNYVESLFVPDDATLRSTLSDSEAAGLPAINVSPNQGKLLYLLARISGARRVLEIGTLGGYSTIWLARALPGDGKLITLELDKKHADVARQNVGRAGLDAIVEIRVGRAIDLLQALIDRREEPFDLIFVDADKPGYVGYLALALQLSRPGTVVLADNLIRDGRVLEDPGDDQNVRAAKAFNAEIAADLRLESTIIPIFKNGIDGMSISIVK